MKLSSATNISSTLLRQCLHIAIIVLMGLLLAGITYEVGAFKDTARVINFTGLIRGDVQRLVKRELTAVPSDTIFYSIDSWIDQLNGKPGSDQLVLLDEPEYQQNLRQLTNMRDELAEGIKAYRETGKKDTILYISEDFYRQADRTAASAEAYAYLQANHLYMMELALACLIIILFSELIVHTAKEVILRNRNQQLNKLAFLDGNTALPNKSACNEIINRHLEPADCFNHACIMFDLNNLKDVNDNFGHEFGDILISSFAYVLQLCLPDGGFVGRFGGDEFIAVFDNIDRAGIEDYISKIMQDVKSYNSKQEHLQVSFAYGYSLHSDDTALNLKEMLVFADKAMYECKRKMKSQQA